MEETPFGRYRLVELLGRGGMGEVWRAHDTVTDRVVAIKVLPAILSEDEDFQRRFRREAHAAARLDTPHVVPIHDYGEIDGRLFVSMRLINGRDLADVLADGPLDPARAVRIIDQVAKALHAAHEVGLIHRDIKPSNILLDRDDFAYLIDFGIARATDDTRLTKTGGTIGTFAYIAPERLDGRAEEDARADIYSLACVLYEALTGEPPFPGGTTALMYAHAHTPPPRPSGNQPDVPARFDAVIAKGMAKDPDHRYATTVELADAARDAITAPLARPQPGPALPPPTEPAPLPTPPPTIAAGPPTPPGYASSPAWQPPPAAVPAHRQEPFADRPPTPPSPPRWRRKAVLIPATLIALVVGTVVAVSLSVTGNSPAGQSGRSGEPSRTALPDAATLLAQSAQSTRALTSAHVVETVRGKIPGLPLKVLTVDLTTTPSSAASGQETISFGGSDIDTNFVVIDGDLYATLTPNKWSDFGKASDIYDPTLLLNPDTGLANILSNFSDAKAVGAETINGEQVVKITGLASADAATKLIPPIAARGPIPGTVWIRPDGDHELVQLTLEPSPGNSIQMTLSNWNLPVTVQKPPVS